MTTQLPSRFSRCCPTVKYISFTIHQLRDLCAKRVPLKQPITSNRTGIICLLSCCSCGKTTRMPTTESLTTSVMSSHSFKISIWNRPMVSFLSAGWIIPPRTTVSMPISFPTDLSASSHWLPCFCNQPRLCLT